MTEQEINEICSSLRVGAATGFDNVPMSIMSVISLFKTDDKSLISNYKPISLLSSFSKILEKVIYNHLMSYLTYKILIINLVFINITLLNML